MRILLVLFIITFYSCNFAGGVIGITGFDTYLNESCIGKFSNEAFKLYKVPDSLFYNKVEYNHLENLENLYINGSIYTLEIYSGIVEVYYVQYEDYTIGGQNNVSETEKDIIIETLKDNVIYQIVKMARKDKWSDSEIFTTSCPTKYKNGFK